MTDNNKISNILDLSPINSSKSDNSPSFFSPRELNLLPFTNSKPDTRLSLNERPSILIKTQPIIQESPSNSTIFVSKKQTNESQNLEKSGFNKIFRTNFLKDLEKKGVFLQKSNKYEEKKTQEGENMIEELKKLEEREKAHVIFFF